MINSYMLLTKLECLVYNPNFSEVEIIRNKIDFYPNKNLYTYRRKSIEPNNQELKELVQFSLF